MSMLTEFYDETGVDCDGRTLSYIWTKDDDYLEFSHNWVQWLFPLKEPSNFNPDAPLLTEEDIAIFKANPYMQTNLLCSFGRYLSLFGLEYKNGEVQKREDFQALLFMHPNHNWFRITRVLTSLRLLGLGAVSVALYKFLKKIHEEDGLVSDNSFSYWTEAVNGLVEM